MGHPLSVGPWAGSLEIDRQSTYLFAKSQANPYLLWGIVGLIVHSCGLPSGKPT